MDEMEPRRLFSVNLDRLTRASGKSRHQLSVETGISEGTLSCYYTGRRFPRPEQLRTLADCLGVTVGDLTDAPGETTDDTRVAELSPDIRMIARAGRKMTPEQAENLRKYAEFMFPEAFGK